MPQGAVARAKAGRSFNRADHEIAPKPDRVFERLAVAEQRRNRG
jgi:hypothetical protein